MRRVRYEIVVGALILMAAVLTYCLVERPPYDFIALGKYGTWIDEPVLTTEEPAGSKELLLPVAEEGIVFIDFGDGQVIIWEGKGCPEPMVVGEMCFSPDTMKMYVGIGSLRVPISIDSLVEYWEQYHRKGE
jgi:hypothetical protein